MLDPLNPAETAVLFIDFQKRWTEDRNISVLSVIDRFAEQVAGLGTHNYWIAHDIGLAYHQPLRLGTVVADQLEQLPADDRMVVDLRRHSGYIVGKHEPGAFTNPHLLEHMQWSGVKQAYACGFIAGQCVASTLAGARDAGFGIGMISDLSVDNLPNGMMCHWSRRAVRRKQVPRVRSSTLLQALRPAGESPKASFHLLNDRPMA